MGLVDFILNLVGLLLWLNWRALRFDPLRQPTPATLVGTLRPASPTPLRGWPLLTSLLVLILFRAFVYWGIGAPAGWTGRLDLGVVLLAFRSDNLNAMFLFSAMSFLRVSLIFYFWLIALNLIDRQLGETDRLMRLIQLHLGLLARWPRAVQVLAPLILVVLLWMLFNPLLAHLGITARSPSLIQPLQQGSLVAASLIFSLKLLLPPLLLLHLVSTYVYLGSSPIWDFINLTARNILAPLQRLPLRTAKIDFAPVAGVILIFLLLHWIPELALSRLGPNRFWP